MIREWQKGDSSSWVDEVFSEFQRESRSAVVQRESEMFDRLAAPLNGRVVLFGAGPLGRYTARGLQYAGAPAVAFADNNMNLWGTTVDGLEVFSPGEAVARYGRTNGFVVTIYNGAAVRTQLASLGCIRVLPFAPLFWKYHEVFIPGSCLDLPHTILDQAADIKSGYRVLADESSRLLFCEQLRWRFLLDFACLSAPLDPADTYFPADLIQPCVEEVFVDCGAFDGDSIRSFLAHRDNRFKSVYAFEPDPANLSRLSEYISTLPRHIAEKITVMPYAVADENGRRGFSPTGTAGSRIAPESTGEIECRRLDDVLRAAEVTYIKMDVEGAEMQALCGAAEIIRAGYAVLAVCVYHRSEHLWRIPSFIHSLGSGHEVFLRRYAEDCWELVCYGVPPARRRRN